MGLGPSFAISVNIVKSVKISLVKFWKLGFTGVRYKTECATGRTWIDYQDCEKHSAVAWTIYTKHVFVFWWDVQNVLCNKLPLIDEW